MGIIFYLYCTMYYNGNSPVQAPNFLFTAFSHSSVGPEDRVSEFLFKNINFLLFVTIFRVLVP